MLEKNGVRVAAISYDSREILAAFADHHSIGFPLLSDAGSETIRAFGIFNFNMAPGLRAYGVPHPVDFLVTPDGTVVRKYFVPNYQHRVSGAAVALREFGTVDGGAPVVTLESGAVSVQIGFPSAEAFAGQEVSFFARFALQPGWHVYETTSVTFEGSAIARQTFKLPALPLYSDSFQATGTLLLKFPLPDGPLVLPGRLEFQQCSDTVCEPPETVHFELPLRLEKFVVSDRDKK